MDAKLFDAFSNDELPRGFTPRPYQLEAERAATAALKDEGRCGIYIATGLGKTEIAALIIRRYIQEHPGKRVVLWTPRQAITGQTLERFRSRGVECGLEMGSSRSDALVTVGCYDSFLSRRRYERFLGSGLVFVDESHLNHTSGAMRMLEHFREHGAAICGMTATPDTGSRDPLSEVYGKPAYVYDYLQACADGWLVPAKVFLTVLESVDLSEWRESFANYGDDSDGKVRSNHHLGKALARREAVTAVAGMVEKYHEGKPSVVFAAGIAQADEIHRDLQARGITSSIVHSQMDAMERQLHLDDFASGKATVIVNVGCLSLGWDSPRAQKLFIARPTKSISLYVQMFGRLVRPLPGVVDGYSRVEDRKAAIARSAKPHMEVYDITDSSRLCDLRSAMDVLHPADPKEKKLLKRVRNRWGQTAKAGEAVALDPILEAERRLEAAREAAIARRELAKREHLYGHATLSAYEYDALGGRERQGGRRAKDYHWMPFGRYRGQRFAVIHADASWYLPYMLEKGRLKDASLRRNVTRFLQRVYPDCDPRTRAAIDKAMAAQQPVA